MSIWFFLRVSTLVFENPTGLSLKEAGCDPSPYSCINALKKKHIFLQKGSSTLDDTSLQHIIAHPAEFFFVYFDVQ